MARSCDMSMRQACLAIVLSMVCTSAAGEPIFRDGFERSITTGCSDPTPPVPASLALHSPYADVEDVEIRTRGIWAVWWYPSFDHASDAETILDRLETVRCNALQYLRMRDPPNPARGYYYNVYIQHGEDDPFPIEWGNGQGTDPDGNPYLTLPSGFLLDEANLDHEGFHVFQFSADSPGYAYAGDSAWYIEASAQWYMSTQNPTGARTFLQAGTIEANPQLALWHGWLNAAPGDPVDWNYTVRQYGMHTFLHYLTVEAGVPDTWMADGFYGGVALSPQAHLYQRIGPAALRRIFADWAAQNTADFQYLTPEQVAVARQESAFYGDPATQHPIVAEHDVLGTGGELLRPDQALTPRGWSYNVIRIVNPSAATYRFTIIGDEHGSEGAAGFFAGRVVVMADSGPVHSSLDMIDALEGSASVTVPAGATDLFLVVAALPEHFAGNQTYSYRYSILRDDP